MRKTPKALVKVKVEGNAGETVNVCPPVVSSTPPPPLTDATIVLDGMPVPAVRMMVAWLARLDSTGGMYEPSAVDGAAASVARGVAHEYVVPALVDIAELYDVPPLLLM